MTTRSAPTLKAGGFGARRPVERGKPSYRDLLEDTDGLRPPSRGGEGRRNPSLFSRGGSLQPSIYADARSPVDVIAFEGPASGNQWTIGAVGNGNFTGVLLRDVLLSLGQCLTTLSRTHKHTNTHTQSLPAENLLEDIGGLLHPPFRRPKGRIRNPAV